MTRRIVLILLTALAAAAAPARPAPAAKPAPPRNLIVFFEFLDNANGVEEAVEFVFERMIRPGDQLIIQSPTRTYGFSPATLAQPKAKLAALTGKRLRSDIARASTGYKQVVRDLETAAAEIAEHAYPTGTVDANKDMNELFIFYRQELGNLNQLRKVNADSLRRLVGTFSGHEGENHLIVLFEREFRPIPRREALNVLSEMPVFAVQANELFATGNMNEVFDIAAMTGHFLGVPLTLHFVYVTSKHISAGGNLFENSGDIYSAFSRLARDTGGVTVTRAEPQAGLEEIVRAWEDEADIRR
jgi:hypothetical protein